MTEQTPFHLDGAVALITGGAGLIGKAICKQLNNLGADVVVADLNEEKAHKLARSLNGNTMVANADISDADSLEKMYDRVGEKFGRLDILVNSAYPKNNQFGEPMERVSADSWNENVNNHLGGYFLTTKHGVDLLSQSDRASVINLGSIYGMQGPDLSLYKDNDLTNPIEYSAIKGGIISLTRYLACYLGSDGIRVNAVSPGGVFNDQPDTFVEQYEAKTILDRMATPEDVAGAVSFLASDAASYVTGHNLVVDGGFTIN